MNSNFDRHVGRIGLLRSGESAQINPAAVDFYSGLPEVPILMSAKQSRGISGIGAMQVLHILSLFNIAKIGPAIVGSFPIDMVNLSGWPFSCHVKPRQSMGEKCLSENCDLQIAACIDAAHFSSAGVPAKYSGLWVVIEKLAQFLRGKIHLSHDALQLLIGQRPACISSALRASLF